MLLVDLETEALSNELLYVFFFKFFAFSFTRIRMDGSISFLCGVSRLGLGQPS